MTKRRRSAFTIAECVIAILVIAIVALGCLWGTKAATQISQTKLEQPVAWYQFLNKLEGDQWSFCLDRVANSGRRLVLINPAGEKYQLLVSNAGMIYLRKLKSNGGQGYLPLYGPVVNQSGLLLKQLDSRRVRIEVKMRDYPLQTATLCFQEPVSITTTR